MGDIFHKLTELFRHFPGIGPRQAKRFAFFLLTAEENFLKELTQKISGLKKDIASCALCNRFFEKRGKAHLCSLCTDKNRDSTQLLVVATDTDLESVEKSGAYRGRYFVLGGTMPLLPKKTTAALRIKELLARVEEEGKQGAGAEIILALSANTEGEHTSDELRIALAPLAATYKLKITALGRGLSTGSELEYADQKTLKDALKNRAS